ncbi:OmpA family protein [Microbacterium sp. HA-8]|uniref:OmpA family protein n=1 Tax=Microbacterium sp. HA-8 TaxID=3234200 RepID=UPI0038F7F512
MNHLTITRTAGAAVIRTVAALLALFLAFSLAACGEQAHEGPTAEECDRLFGSAIADAAPAGVLVFDASRSRPSGGLSAEAAESIRALSAEKGSISVLLVDGEGAKPYWVLSDVALNRADAGTDTAVYKTAVTRSVPCIERALAAQTPTAPGSDIAEAIRAAAEHGATAGVTTYVVETDGFANTGALNVTGTVNDVTVADVVSGLDAVGWNPRFDGASVTVTGVARSFGVIVAPAHADWLRSLYQALCERSGATTCSVPITDQAIAVGGESERSNAPEDADLQLAAITGVRTDAGSTIVVPGSLLFAPNSPALATDADTVLAEVVQCVRSGARIEVRGHAAYDASAPEGFAEQLSSQRAEAAKARVLDLAGGVGEVSAVGFGDTQPVPGGAPAQNRRVEFVIDGGC